MHFQAFIDSLDLSDLSQNKIKTENSLRFNPELTLKRGNYSKKKPNNSDQHALPGKALLVIMYQTNKQRL